MKTKFITLLITSGIITGVLTGCSNNDDGAGESLTIDKTEVAVKLTEAAKIQITALGMPELLLPG